MDFAAATTFSFFSWLSSFTTSTGSYSSEPDQSAAGLREPADLASAIGNLWQQRNLAYWLINKANGV